MISHHYIMPSKIILLVVAWVLGLLFLCSLCLCPLSWRSFCLLVSSCCPSSFLAACAPLCHHDRRWCCGLNFGKDLGGCSSCSCCSCVLAGQSDGAMALDKWNGDVGGVVESERNGSAVMCRGCADLLVRWLYSLWSWQHTCMQWPSCLQLGPICPKIGRASCRERVSRLV